MLSWIIQISIVSIVFIFLVHHLITFLKSTLTVPKIKDLVNSPSQKYQDMFDTMTNSQSSNNPLNTTSIDNLHSSQDNITYSMSDLLPKEDTSMKDELKNFLKMQLNPNNVMGVDMNNLDNQYTNL